MTAFKGDLCAAIAAHKDSPVKYGSEFRNTTALETLFLHHEDKTKIISIIKHGTRYHLGPIFHFGDSTTHAYRFSVFLDFPRRVGGWILAP